MTDPRAYEKRLERELCKAREALRIAHAILVSLELTNRLRCSRCFAELIDEGHDDACELATAIDAVAEQLNARGSLGASVREADEQ